MTEWGLTRLQLFLSLAWTRSLWHELWLKVWNVLGKQNRVACWWHFPFSGKARLSAFCGIALKACRGLSCYKRTKFGALFSLFPPCLMFSYEKAYFARSLSSLHLSLAHHKVHVPLLTALRARRARWHVFMKWSVKRRKQFCAFSMSALHFETKEMVKLVWNFEK